ncbi:MAG: nicotinamide-nucleotide amidohydrolase family protein [Lachnospiraceae bacterium]|nr:nicotinamide-nucleotide amidohydrolase family protein [Lachnospiraceae bacterium]
MRERKGRRETMIDLNILRENAPITVVGHPVADFDCYASGFLMEYVLTALGIEAHFATPDGSVDEYFEKKAEEIDFHKKAAGGIRAEDTLFLVDHTAQYPNKVVGCFDHHPPLCEIPVNYERDHSTCCAIMIYRWAESLGIEIPRKLTAFTVYANYMDSLSFKSSKGRKEDRAWCVEKIRELGMDEAEVVDFGYGLTDASLPFEAFLLTGLKTYPLTVGADPTKAAAAKPATVDNRSVQVSPSRDRVLKASYIVAKSSEIDVKRVVEVLSGHLDDEVAAWCFIINNVADDETRLLVITKRFYTDQTIRRNLGRGNDIIPSLQNMLSFRNDGTITSWLIEKNLQISTMESCTSGLIASTITDYEGASAILKGSLITYSNEAKILEGVAADVIEQSGVYSRETAAEMARNTKRIFRSDVGIGITGSFGNLDPANPDSVAGEIYLQVEYTGREAPVKMVMRDLTQSRKEIKQSVTHLALAIVWATLRYQVRADA